VGAGLLAKADSSHIDAGCAAAFASKPTPTKISVLFLEIVENNIRNLLKRDIKPLQIAVFPQF
jgi:hypothetical protein